jgi:hypothetical protein
MKEKKNRIPSRLPLTGEAHRTEARMRVLEAQTLDGDAWWPAPPQGGSGR